MVKNNIPSYWSKSLFQFFHKGIYNANGLKVSYGTFIIAILALPRNIGLLKLLFAAIANGFLKTFADSFISFGGILFIPVDFLLSIFLKSCSTSQVEILERWLFAAVRFFSVFFFFSFYTFMISKRLRNYFYYVFVVFNFLFFCNVGWFVSARALYYIYVVVIENS